MLIDTHCHLAFKAFNDSWPEVVKRAREKGIQMIAVGAAKATSEKSIAIAEQSDGVFAAIGLHPTHVEDEPFDYDWFSQAADNPKVVAIGETGIDYFHLDDASSHPELVSGSEKQMPKRVRHDGEKKRAVVLQKQEDLLRQHLTIAREKELPVILHSRDGKTESATTLDTTPRLRQGFGGQAFPLLPPIRRAGKEEGILSSYEHLYKIIADFGYTRCVLHCFGGDWAAAQKFLELGCLISFTGIVTFKNASDSLKEVVRNVPLDRFMIETDSPYLAPEPYRGKQNEPAHIEHIARAIAEMRGVEYDVIAEATTENAKSFFGL